MAASSRCNDSFLDFSSKKCVEHVNMAHNQHQTTVHVPCLESFLRNAVKCQALSNKLYAHYKEYTEHVQ